jgi:hypothetical protein
MTCCNLTEVVLLLLLLLVPSLGSQGRAPNIQPWRWSTTRSHKERSICQTIAYVCPIDSPIIIEQCCPDAVPATAAREPRPDAVLVHAAHSLHKVQHILTTASPPHKHVV